MQITVNSRGGSVNGLINLAIAPRLGPGRSGAFGAGLEKAGSARAKSLAGVGQMLWPFCQQGLTRLICHFSADRVRCARVARISGELATSKASGSILFAVGVAADAWRMKSAIGRSFESKTVRPAAAQATRSLTTWGAAWAGAELLGIGGALAGLETGPGAVVTGGIGALVGGCLGMFASDWLAQKIEPIAKTASEDDYAIDHCAC